MLAFPGVCQGAVAAELENKGKVRCCGWARIKLRNINVLWKPLWGQEGDNTRLILFAKPPSDFAAVSPALVQTLPAVISQPGLSLPALPQALQGIRAKGLCWKEWNRSFPTCIKILHPKWGYLPFVAAQVLGDKPCHPQS